MNELSIVIPCTSSVGVLPKFMDELALYLMSNPSDVDVIVVANENVRSADQVVSQVRKKYPWLKFEMVQRVGNPRHYGALARFGVAYSTSRYVVFVSPYGDDDISIINQMLSRIRKGAQVIQATRYSDSSNSRNVQLRFRMYQRIYHFLTRLFLRFNISDSTYGFKMFDRVFIQALGLSQNGYSICPEITLKTLLAGGKVDYIPSTVRRRDIKTDFRLHREGVGYLWLLIRGLAHRIGILWF